MPRGSRSSTAIRAHRPAEPAARLVQEQLGLDGHAVHDEPPARRQRRPARVEQRARGPAADEDRVGPSAARRRPRATPPRRRRARAPRAPGRCAGSVRPASGSRSTACTSLRGCARANSMPDGAGTRAEVPQDVAGLGREVREGGRAHEPLGQLPVVVVCRVAAVPARATSRSASGAASHSTQTRCNRGLGRPSHDAATPSSAGLGRRAEVTEHREAARGIPLLDEQGRDAGRGVVPRGQHDEPCPRREVTAQSVDVSSDEGHDVGILCGPAHPGAGQGDRRDRRGGSAPRRRPSSRRRASSRCPRRGGRRSRARRRATRAGLVEHLAAGAGAGATARARARGRDARRASRDDARRR